MNHLKLLTTLVFGIILGYSLTQLSIEPINETFINAEQCPVISTVAIQQTNSLAEKLTAKENNNADSITLVAPLTHIQQSCDELILSNQTFWLEENQDLADKYQALEQKYKLSSTKLDYLQARLRDFNESDITDEQLHLLVPKEFSALLTNYTGETRDSIHEFHQAEEDSDWGYDISQKIADFIATHEKGLGVELVSALCKSSQCELLIKETQEHALNTIIKQIRKESWWRFTSNKSSSRNNDDTSVYYIYLSGYRHG